METTTPILSARSVHICFNLRGRVLHATRGIDLDIQQGEVLAIVGESGSGKSVTSSSVMRLMPSKTAKIVEGSITFEGIDLLKLSQKDLLKFRGDECCMIFQNPMTCLNPVYTIGNQLIEALKAHDKKVSKEEAAKRAMEMLELVGINNVQKRMKQYPHEFSGGMRQRVMIAMALACEPKLLIADEPTTALDVTIQAQILHLMNNLKEEHGTAIMFITHDLGVINQMADDVAVMYCGQVVEHVPARVLFSRKAKYSHPYTEGLLASVPRLDTKSSRLDAIPGAVPHPLDLPKGCKFAPRCKYCTKRCMEEEPDLMKVGENQEIRCFYPEKEARHAK